VVSRPAVCASIQAVLPAERGGLHRVECAMGELGMEREILHVNTDDFYASVLRLRDPTLRGKAVVVAGPPPRGMVLSASYEARSDGVSRGMTVSAARRLCSLGAFLLPDWQLFRKASHAFFGVLRRYSPLVETASLDEGYIDYTGCRRLFGHVLDAGSRIKEEILRETGLQVSLGVASNKLVSHVASRRAKCAHLVDVYPGYERSFLAPVPIHRFPIVGERRAPMLRELGITRVGDILLFTEEIFSFCFGSWGRRLYRGAMGEDSAPVRVHPTPDERFTVGEILEPDRVHRRFIESVLYLLAERLGERLRSERSRAGSVILEVHYADGVTVRGVGKLRSPGSADSPLFEAARGVFTRIFTRRVRVRRLLLSAGRIEPEPLQIELFADGAPGERVRRLHAALDRLRSTFPEGVAPAFGRARESRSPKHRDRPAAPAGQPRAQRASPGSARARE
jgi:DNA polymerase-4